LLTHTLCRDWCHLRCSHVYVFVFVCVHTRCSSSKWRGERAPGGRTVDRISPVATAHLHKTTGECPVNCSVKEHERQPVSVMLLNVLLHTNHLQL